MSLLGPAEALAVSPESCSRRAELVLKQFSARGGAGEPAAGHGSALGGRGGSERVAPAVNSEEK